VNLALEPAATLDELLRRARASERPAGVSLADGRGRPGPRRAWSEVLAAAEVAAGRLAALGVERGEPLLLVLNTGDEFLELWLGAVLRGALPVAAAPPGGLGSSEHALQKLGAVFERLGGRRAVGAEALACDARGAGQARLGDALVTPEALADRAPASFEAPRPAEGDVAFLQLTSGSTGVPRAVEVSQRGAAHNPRAMLAAVCAADERLAAGLQDGTAACVSWLPLHHDMGLVGCFLTALCAGADLLLAPPRAFLGRPETWLANLASVPLAVAAAPNFAYELCTERADPAALAGRGLSGWRAALCGSEMIRAETAAAFAARFATHGFDPAAFRACYGLAEGTLAVTFDTRGAGLRTGAPAGDAARAVACVGAPVLDTSVRVTAPDGAPLPDGAVGEVRVRGPGVFLGYRADPAATAECLRDGWLLTGDLGFLRAGELYLTGRTKEILILNGQNLMPHELEWAAEAAAGGGAPARAAAFSIDGPGGERAVVVLETSETEPARLAELAREVKLKVGRAAGVPLADCVLVRRGRLPKTTSGKLMRGELRARYLAGEVERLPAEGPA
jgi:acyl-CoA synthetase (AMP-forming)/AMP-acid ligase II